MFIDFANLFVDFADLVVDFADLFVDFADLFVDFADLVVDFAELRVAGCLRARTKGKLTYRDFRRVQVVGAVIIPMLRWQNKKI